LKRWVRNHAIEVPIEVAADGIGELWFDSPAPMEQTLNLPQMAAAVKDAKTFLDMERT
jgi:hypothetical protein